MRKVLVGGVPIEAAYGSVRVAVVFDLLIFSLSVLAVLLTPGPTNTLLATGGATMGWRRASVLIPAELGGYLISIATLSLALVPMSKASPTISVGLRLGCAVYLAYAAWRLWHYGSASVDTRTVVRFRDVFVTTLLNPKALLFAVGIFPSTGTMAFFLFHLAIFSILCIGVSFTWIVFGAALDLTSRGFLSRRRFAQGGAAILACLSLFLIRSTI